MSRTSAGLAGDLLDDDLPHTTLSYANGKGYYMHNVLDDEATNVTRLNLTRIPEERIKSFDFVQVNVRELPYMMSAKFSDFWTPSPLFPFGTDLFHTTSLTISAFPWPPSP